MCELCEKYGIEAMYCVDCGAMICFDVKQNDDVLKRAYITGSGDLRCNECGQLYDRYDEEDDRYYAAQVGRFAK